MVNVWGGERLGWWRSDFTLGVVNVWGGERLGWWTSEVVNVWGGERLGWWTSDFTQGVVNVWGGECLGGEGLTIISCQRCQRRWTRPKRRFYAYFRRFAQILDCFMLMICIFTCIVVLIFIRQKVHSCKLMYASCMPVSCLPFFSSLACLYCLS